MKKIFKNIICVFLKINFLMIGFISGHSTQVETPTFSIPSGKYNTPISVKIQCSTPDSKIYYTTDETMPTTASNLYSGEPILVSNHVTGDSVTFDCDNDPDNNDPYLPITSVSKIIKAIAIKEGMENSEVTSASYVIDLVNASFNIPYDEPPTEGGSKHQLDIYQPSEIENTPVLFFIHGGAWKSGDKNMYFELGNTFAGFYQYTTVVANYELSSDPWNAIHPDHIEDVAKALAWVYNHIDEYGGDTSQIYIFGQSAGAHLVSLLATDGHYMDNNGLSQKIIKGVISMSGAYNLFDLVKWPLNPLNLSTIDVLMYKEILLSAFGSWEEGVLDSGSPATFVNSEQPPFCLINLNETSTFTDMSGFSNEANNFYEQIKLMDKPLVEIKYLEETDIPQEIRDINFTNGLYDGHYEEIYSINTKFWDSVPAKMVSDFVLLQVNNTGYEPKPFNFVLNQNYPNPFNSSTLISFAIPVAGNVKLVVYNLLGQKIAVLLNQTMEVGNYKVQFNGNGLTSGVYFYKIQSGNFVSVKKMILVK